MAAGPSFWVPRARGGDGAGYRLEASEAACIGIPGRRALMGGVTTGAAIEAMERATGKALLWASAQFVAPAPTETDLDIDVERVGGSDRRPQARATVAAGGRPIAFVSGALGPSGEEGGHSFGELPPLPAPDACPVLGAGASAAAGGLLDQFERRVARQDDAAGRQALWFRPASGQRVCAGLLAVIGDFAPGAHPDTRGSIGLDNTLRMVARTPSEWILADTHIAHVGPRAFHGGMRLFSESGQLLAISSLTGIRPRAER